MWRLTKSTQGGSRDQSGGPGKKDPGDSSGIPTRCQALPGARTGILKQERQGPCPQEEPGCVCVCLCACVKCEMWYTCVVCGW